MWTDRLANADLAPTGVPRTQLRAVADGQRAPVEAFIREVYAAQHGARIRHFLPELYALKDPQQQIVAALGLRAATTAPLFLEHYLTQPVEQAIAASSNRPVCRHQIVEVGNLAGATPGALRQLLPAMGEVLRQRGFRWLCFTGHSRLVNSFRRLEIPLLPLAAACLEALPPHEREDWGRYYLDDPMVVACDIGIGHAQLLKHPDRLTGRLAARQAGRHGRGRRSPA